jgi:hypothetical protein
LQPTASLGRTGYARTKSDWRELCALGVVLVVALAVVVVWVYTKPIVFTQDIVKYIMTEQMFLFATMLSAYGLVSYLMARTTRDAKRAIIELGLAVVVMTLTRPQGAFLLLVLFGLAAVLVWRRAWIALTAAVAVYAAVWCIQAVDQRIRSDAYSFAGSLDNSRLGGKALLFAVYLDGSRANIRLLQTVSQQFWRQK